jgi:uncharacterized protein (DUF58 family)
MRFLRQFGHPTREGIYFIAMLGFVFTGAILREINMMLLIGGLMVGPLLYNILASRRTVWKLKLKRTLPTGIHAGQVAVIGCQLDSSFNIRNVLLHERIKHSDILQDTTLIEIPVPQQNRQASVPFSYRIKPKHRGTYSFEGGSFSSSAPLGFWKNSYSIAESQQWLVWPEVGQLRNKSIPGLQGVPTSSTSRGQAVAAQQGDYAGLRAWQVGDRQRDIHWRSSARRNELLVKQYDDRTEREWTLILDLTIPHSPTSADQEQVEYAVCMAATLIDHYQKTYQGRLTLVTVGENIHLQAGQTQHRFVNSLYEHLALVRAGEKIATVTDKDIPAIRKQLSSVQPRRALLITTQNLLPKSPDSHSELPQLSNFQQFIKQHQIWMNCHVDLRSTCDVTWQKMFAWDK